MFLVGFGLSSGAGLAELNLRMKRMLNYLSTPCLWLPVCVVWSRKRRRYFTQEPHTFLKNTPKNLDFAVRDKP